MEYLQHALVTLIALAAVVVVFRRVAGFVRPAATPGCANCPSAAKAAPINQAGEHPLVFIRSNRQ